MTDGTRILRTIGVPLVLAIILLVVLPRMCARAIDAARLQSGTPAAPTASSAAVTADSTAGGLHISSTSPDAPLPPRPQSYPAGLDATRVQYLVEIDPAFSQAATTRVPKSDAGGGSDVATRYPIVPVVLRLGYFQPAGEAYTPTREASLHLDGMSEDTAGWVVPIGRRVFDSVARVEDAGDGRYRATYRWRWEPNTIGRELLAKPKIHEATAEFSGGERHWALVQTQGLDQSFD